MLTPTISIFTASSIFDFPNQRAAIGNLTRQLNDRLMDTLWTDNFRCENASELVRPDGAQSGYNQELARSDLFLALIKGDHLGRYTQQEIELAARLHRETGTPKRLLVCLSGRDTLPDALAPLAEALEVHVFTTDRELKQLYLDALAALHPAYSRVTLNQKGGVTLR